MSYRNITVDGKEYQYALGRTHLKIKQDGKHFKLVKVADVGNQIYNSDQYRVTPATVVKVIKGEEADLPFLFHCETHDYKTTKLAYDPYHAEIRGKYHHMMYCPECVEQRSWDI